MKKYLLIASLFITLAGKSQDLINNYGFDNWAIDTFILVPGTIGSLPADTVMYLDPVGWTSSNSLSDLDSLGSEILVLPDSSPQSGPLAIKMLTQTLHVAPSVITALGGGTGFVSGITLPGFVLNGKFPIGVGTLENNLFGTITPASVKGAGQPFTQRLADIKGYVKYTPHYDDSTHVTDSCMVYATLRKGTEIIANAIFKSADSTFGNWVPFSANFVYVSCDQPDTLVILLASSVPNVLQIINQSSTGLQPGSVFSVDSLNYDTLAASYVFPVWPVADLDTVIENSTNNLLDVTTNDQDCSNLPLTASIVSGPYWGTATPASDSTISYTPNHGYYGYDTIIYSSHNTGGDSANAQLTIYVNNTTGINPVNVLKVSVYPVPASSELNVNFENPGKTYARVYDMLGKLVATTTFTSNYNRLDVGSLADGMYSIELLNDGNLIVARTKFNIVK